MGKARLPTLTTCGQYSAGSPNQNDKTRKRNKSYPFRKGRRKFIFLFADGIIFVRNFKDSTKKSC